MTRPQRVNVMKLANLAIRTFRETKLMGGHN